MIMFVIFVVNACDVETSQLQIYPTANKTYFLPLQYLFFGFNLTFRCENCPQSLQLINPMNSLYIDDYKNYTTISLDSNRTHFVTITDKQQFQLFEFSNNIMQLQNSIQLNVSLKCFNPFFIQLEIWLDCYDNSNNLAFYYLNGTYLQQFQQSNNYIPSRTKIQILFAQNQTFLIYGQYYNKYEILTFFSYNQYNFTNLTTWQTPFADFATSRKGFIYIINPAYGIYQVNVSSKLIFESYSFNTANTQLLNLGVGELFNRNSQLDYLITGSAQQRLIVYIAWNASILALGEYLLPSLSADCFNSFTYVEIQISLKFVAVQCNNSFTFIAQEAFSKTITSNRYHIFKPETTNIQTQIYSYFDIYNNNIFFFSNNIEVYSIRDPQLFGIFNESTNNNEFRILATDHYTPLSSRYCEMKITYQILAENDTNIYILYNKGNKPTLSVSNSGFTQFLTTFSGPFVQATGVLINETLGGFSDITFQSINVNIQQSFSISKLFYLDYEKSSEIILVGANQQNLYFYFCQLNMMCTQVYQNSGVYQINNIQITYCYSGILIVGINQGIGEIEIYQFYIRQQKLKASSLYHFSAYSQFQLTFEYLIVLQTNYEIILQPYAAQQNQIVMTGKYINDLFFQLTNSQFEFTPKQIELNEQQQSGILFINNGANLLILLIENSVIIPLHKLNFEFQINKVNLLYSLFVISYQCSDLLCFQVWNNNNILNPNLFQILPSLSVSSGWDIASDINFLYVIDQNNNMNVLNPNFNYHNSLYYQFNFNGSYFSGIYIESEKYSVVTFGNQYFFLRVTLTQEFTPNAMTPSTNYITQTLYHYNISNPFNFFTETENTILSIFDPLVNIFFNEDIAVVKYSKYGQVILNISEQIQSSGQILYFQPSNDDSSLCNITNYMKLTSSNPTNSTILTILNGQLIQQNSFSLIYGVSELYNYSYQYPFTQCSLSSTYEFMLVSFCQNKQGKYLTSFLSQDWNNESSIIQRIYIFQTNFVFLGQQKLVLVDYNNALIILTNTFQQPQVYVLNFNESSLNITAITSCRYGVQDFTIKQDDKNNLFLLLYFCLNRVYYQTGQMFNNTLTFVGLQHELLNTHKQNSLDQSEFLQIEFLEVKFNEILILLTTTNITSFILAASVSKFESQFFELNLQDIIQTIPPYGNYTQTYNTVVSHGLILSVYNSINQRVYAVYNYATMEKSFQSPLLMEGGIAQNLPVPMSVVWNISSYWQGGQLFDITNGILNEYSLLNSPPYLTCNLENKTVANYTLVALNNFSNNSLIIQFQYIENHNQWLVGLIVFVVIVFGIAIIVYWCKTRNIVIKKETDEVDYQELEFEL